MSASPEMASAPQAGPERRPARHLELTGPDRALRAIVVVPARDEAERIGECLHALAAQTVARASYEVIVVLDGCADATARVVRGLARKLAGLTLGVLELPPVGVGRARRIGMDLAGGEQMLALGDRERR